MAAALPLLACLAQPAEPACAARARSRVAEENALEGAPSVEWDINGAGDPSIQGFATEASVPPGGTIHFKVDTEAQSYRMDVYRLGYYGGAGARRVATVPRNGAPQRQPACAFDEPTLLVDCSNWAVSLSWAVPAEAVSGIYFARLVRTDTTPVDAWRADHSPVLADPKFGRAGWDPKVRPAGGMGTHAYGVAGHGTRRNALREPRASHAYFVVRDESGASEILFQTADATWQAYNCWGTTNTYGVPCHEPALHAGSPPPPNATRRAFKASYNRPMATRAYRHVNMPLANEYPAVRWLERNGFDVGYWTSVDADRYASRLERGSAHRLYLSVGHDEYWSGAQRRGVSAARDRGMNLAFFSGNEVYWRVRWETDASGTPHRTLVVYKETQDVRKIDPLPNEWTGTWRDGRPINPLGAQPENELTGTIFTVNAWRNDPLTVPARYGRLRFWRHTQIASLAPGSSVNLVQGLLGHEWDEDVDNGHRPAGLIHLSETTVDDVQYLQDEGATYDTGTATHHLTLYRHASGALVFGAGTCQWAWGLDGHHDNVGGLDLQLGRNCYSLRVGVDPLRPDGDATIQQATLNLFADMRVLPSTPQPDLTLSHASADAAPPTIHARARASGRHLVGYAVDEGGGIVAAVELSADGGATWHPTELDLDRGAWSVACGARSLWDSRDPCGSEGKLMARAADDSGNLSPPLALDVIVDE